MNISIFKNKFKNHDIRTFILDNSLWNDKQRKVSIYWTLNMWQVLCQEFAIYYVIWMSQEPCETQFVISIIWMTKLMAERLVTS